MEEHPLAKLAVRPLPQAPPRPTIEHLVSKVGPHKNDDQLDAQAILRSVLGQLGT